MITKTFFICLFFFLVCFCWIAATPNLTDKTCFSTIKTRCAHIRIRVPTLHSGRLPWRGPLWSCFPLRGGGTGTVEDFGGGRGERGERDDAWRGCGGGGRGEGGNARLGSRGGSGGGAGVRRRRRRLRRCGFRGGGLPPALQGVEGDPARLRLGLGAGRALLFLRADDAGRVLGGGGGGALGRGRLGRVALRLRARRRRPRRLLALLVHGTVGGEDLEDGRLLQRSPQLPGGEAQEGAVAVRGGHGQEGAITGPAEERRRDGLVNICSNMTRRTRDIR